MATNRYFIIYKPFGILSQFSGDKDTLKEVYDFPKEVYPIGRLDKDSEGLLLISDDKALNHHLLNPHFGHHRTYLAQVEGIPDTEDMEELERGVEINVDGKNYLTQKAKATIKANSPPLPDRIPPIRYRKYVSDSWIELTLTEGKNRQVRKMTAAVGHPTLRLVRWSMKNLTIEGFDSGDVRELEQDELFRFLNIDPGKLRQKENFSGRKSFPKHSVRRRKP